jgi:hypothetical protein
VNRLDQETAKEARAHKGCRTIQEEEEKKKVIMNAGAMKKEEIVDFLKALCRFCLAKPRRDHKSHHRSGLQTLPFVIRVVHGSVRAKSIHYTN